ncbi:MAG: TonB family protein [Deltaproteobacteria bacterium]|nr:TonB family protein [Deltaproteobacteria bacterium]
MSEGGRGRKRRKFGAALVSSLLLHAGLAGLLIWRLWEVHSTPQSTVRDPGPTFETEPTLVELAMASEILPQTPEPVHSVLPEHEVDRRSEVVNASSPVFANGPEATRPAPDKGKNEGSSEPTVAARPDQSTSRQQLTDGASTYRQARSKIGWHLASPEPERREEEVGNGTTIAADSRAAEVALVPQVVDGDNPGSRQQGNAVADRNAAAHVTGEGPLQTRVGPQRFDTDVKGPAVDEVATRSASNERDPKPTEAATVGSVGSAAQHRGPGNSPGAVAMATRGDALAQHGSPVLAPKGRAVAVSAVEARRIGFEREIQARAGRAVVFPRQLALMLEQGDSIVRFVVGRDGQIEGPVAIVRSAGFPEFDAAAQSAAQRAAPYPKMPEPLTVNLRVVFSNPMIR